jgi:hypothetical protein
MIFPLLTVRRTWRPALPACRGRAWSRTEIFELFPGAQGHAKPPRRRPVGRAAAAAGHCAGADHQAEAVAAGRADRGHPAQHHPADRPGDRAILRDQGEMAIVLVEQYFEFAYGLADRFCVLERGEVKIEGDRESVSKESLREAVSV